MRLNIHKEETKTVTCKSPSTCTILEQTLYCGFSSGNFEVSDKNFFHSTESSPEDPPTCRSFLFNTLTRYSLAHLPPAKHFKDISRTILSHSLVSLKTACSSNFSQVSRSIGSSRIILLIKSMNRMDAEFVRNSSRGSKLIFTLCCISSLKKVVLISKGLPLLVNK